MTAFRALCAELVEAWDGLPWECDWKGNPVGPLADIDEEPFERARAALAQPEPQGPTDKELHQLWQELYSFHDGPTSGEVAEIARAVLTRWGRPAIEPVPVVERLPEAGDWVWHCYAGARLWEQGIFDGRKFFIGDGPYSQPATHWLPHHALPVPQQGE